MPSGATCRVASNVVPGGVRGQPDGVITAMCFAQVK